jgi:hypothetical protein
MTLFKYTQSTCEIYQDLYKINIGGKRRTLNPFYDVLGSTKIYKNPSGSIRI